jgi:hypothetical protein
MRARISGLSRVWPVIAVALLAPAMFVLAISVSAHAQGSPAPDLTLPAPAGLAYVTGTARSAPTVWAARTSGREAKRLGPGLEPLLAPDGRAVAAVAFNAGVQEQGPAIVIYSTNGGAGGSYLNLATATAQPLAFSPDSRYLAVALQSTMLPGEAGSGLAVIDTSTGVVDTIAHGQVQGASFAPDGSDRIVYGLAPSLAVSAPVNLYVAQPNGSATQALTHDGRSLNPVWGPRYIAYDHERLRPNYAPRYDIWLRSSAPGSSTARRLTNVPAGNLVVGLVPVAFSAAGDRLLAEFEGQDTSEAWTVRVPSGRVRRLTVRGQAVQGTGISRDGRTVLIEQGAFENPPSRGRVASIPFAGGRPRVLVAHGAQPSWNR